ncbi:uncharacterized protein BXIN_0199 [Babesia sp. Xinjiang]|uniref:uncharacterized protein n=1 Tax=Babesia sp. Xinjiang TaxID=462227 RepID=UPI000A25F3E7|nr:uncharacterized protein BXIN_0199 [Babesia sp. Xinjiang]ORM39841.1 hypothetical protein BXIN_0199 [Babesia sp. Xinjiang]
MERKQTSTITPSTTAATYLERMYDHDVADFMGLLRRGIFDRAEDLRVLFTNFQRYLSQLKAEEFVELLEVLHSRDLRENEERIDIPLIMLCEMNHRILKGNRRLFSLNQTQRLCTVLRHVRFNRPNCLIAQDEAANGITSNNEDFQHGFKIKRQTITPEKQSNHYNISTSCESVQHENLEDEPSSSSHCILQHDFQEVLVPVCEVNINNPGNTRACKSCCNKYGDLLQLHGYDQLTLLIVLLGRSIVQQVARVRRRHENAVISYMTLSSHLNCTINSHILRSMLAQQKAALLRTKSMRNIGIVLHMAKKCKVRFGSFKKQILQRLADYNEFKSLAAAERSIPTLLIAFSQIIGGLVDANRLPITKYKKQTGINIIIYLVDNHTKLIQDDCEGISDAINGVRGSVRLLVSYLTSKGVDLSKIMNEPDLDVLYSITATGNMEYAKDFRTSDLHRQVASVLATLGIETEEEVRIGSHVCDLILRRNKVAVEIDGPYHFNTALNYRVNALLHRDTDECLLTYTHNSKLKRFMLGLEGYRVVHIPYFRWPCARQEQIAYAHRTINY